MIGTFSSITTDNRTLPLQNKAVRYIKNSNKDNNILCLPLAVFITLIPVEMRRRLRGTKRQFSGHICLEDDLRFRIFETLVKFLACLPLLGFLNI